MEQNGITVVVPKPSDVVILDTDQPSKSMSTRPEYDPLLPSELSLVLSNSKAFKYDLTITDCDPYPLFGTNDALHCFTPGTDFYTYLNSDYNFVNTIFRTDNTDLLVLMKKKRKLSDSQPFSYPALQPPTTSATAASVSIPLPPIPKFSLHFYGSQWVLQSGSDSTSVAQQPQPLTSSQDSETSPAPCEETEEDTTHYVTTPDSDVDERLPPSSLEAMRNYSDFVLHMAKSIEFPIHHPKPRNTNHIFSKISSEDTAPVHLPMFPSFISMAEELFKKDCLSIYIYIPVD
ncbi:hypothetical protein JRQ81_009087 [Phrynocephalus forsythii]|uniref:Uncharacterized protein n=1 Tax=Phrynocephalus forsythii TaxID=171643 RepID=A0A9Q0Y5K2_9SAUR|nr:hypothetical protein JRQ81_009087 [Phrynocephalus forsythii]